MNCKKGDFAMYVGVIPEIRGQITQCVELDNSWRDGRPSWVVDPPLGRFDVALDAALRPIRHPGLNAVDEMVQRCGKPGAFKQPVYYAQNLVPRLNGWGTK
jgi:hypothetical protein